MGCFVPALGEVSLVGGGARGPPGKHVFLHTGSGVCAVDLSEELCVARVEEAVLGHGIRRCRDGRVCRIV